MTKPLVVFTGAALASLAALLGVTADKWQVQPVSATGAQISSGSADAAPSPAATVAAEKQDAAPADQPSDGKSAPSELAAVSPEPTVPEHPTPPSELDAAVDDSKPSFDTIRVEPDGSAVIAGRGLPDSNVEILFNDQAIGSAKADEAGAWVLVPEEPLPVGDHQVTLRMLQPDAPPVLSEQSVALKVPERGTDQAMVVLSEQNQPSKVLQLPQASDAAEPVEAPGSAAEPQVAAAPEATSETSAAAPEASISDAPAAPEVTAQPEAAVGLETPPSPPVPAQSTVASLDQDDEKTSSGKVDAGEAEADLSGPLVDRPLALSTVDYNDRGDILFSGTADGGATVRLYVDNSHVGDAKTKRGGQWQFAGKENIKPGTHSLRVDKLNADGSVSERVELPFVRAEPSAVAALVERSPQPATDEVESKTVPPAPQQATKPATEATEAAIAATAPPPADVAVAEKAGGTETVEPSAAAPPAAEPTVAAAAPPPSDESGEPGTVDRTGAADLASVEVAPATEAVAQAPSSSPPALPEPSQHAEPAMEPPDPAPAAEELAATEVVQQPVEAAAKLTTPSATTSDEAPTFAAPSSSGEVPGATTLAGSTAGEASEEPPQTAASPPAQSTTVVDTAAAVPSADAAPAVDSTPSPSAVAPAAGSAEMAVQADTSSASQTAPAVAAAQPAAGQLRNGRVVIQPGNSLWRISRVIYGQGIQYTIIYQANKDQIRDPELIYPGQIFATPGVVPPESIDPKLKEPLPGVARSTTSG
jgi:nucleoid-associated protein YgaU